MPPALPEFPHFGFGGSAVQTNEANRLAPGATQRVADNAARRVRAQQPRVGQAQPSAPSEGGGTARNVVRAIADALSDVVASRRGQPLPSIARRRQRLIGRQQDAQAKRQQQKEARLRRDARTDFAERLVKVARGIPPGPQRTALIEGLVRNRGDDANDPVFQAITGLAQEEGPFAQKTREAAALTGRPEADIAETLLSPNMSDDAFESRLTKMLADGTITESQAADFRLRKQEKDVTIGKGITINTGDLSGPGGMTKAQKGKLRDKITSGLATAEEGNVLLKKLEEAGRAGAGISGAAIERVGGFLSQLGPIGRTVEGFLPGERDKIVAFRSSARNFVAQALSTVTGEVGRYTEQDVQRANEILKALPLDAGFEDIKTALDSFLGLNDRSNRRNAGEVASALGLDLRSLDDMERLVDELIKLGIPESDAISLALDQRDFIQGEGVRP